MKISDDMKGQGALEYLMTYGWALLVIVVVGAALYGLGVLNPSTYAKAACTGFVYFNHVDHKMSSNGNFSVRVNNGPYVINLLNVSIRNPGGVWSYGSVQYGVNASENPKGPAANVGPAETRQVAIYEPLFSGEAGQPYKYEVRIIYVTREGDRHEDVATCIGKYESV